MLTTLGLLEAQGEIAVVLGAAEVRKLSQTEPKDAIDKRIGELEIRAFSHPDPIVILLEPAIDPVQLAVRARQVRNAGHRDALRDMKAGRLCISTAVGGRCCWVHP